MTALTVKAPRPTPEALTAVVRQARQLAAGDRHVYWIGDLGLDRTKSLQLHQQAAGWLTLDAMGVVMLTQRAICAEDSNRRSFEYRATRTSADFPRGLR